MTEYSRHILHLSVAEHGKLCLLRGDIAEALRHFREAIRISVSAHAPEVFFRHYSQCVLEALEYGRSYSEIVDYCTEADAFYAGRDLTTNFHRKDYGSIIERLAVSQILLDQRDEARTSLERAIVIAGKGVLPLAEDLLVWMLRGYSISAERIAQLQKRHNYFVIRNGSVDESIARPLPEAAGRTGFAAVQM